MRVAQEFFVSLTTNLRRETFFVLLSAILLGVVASPRTTWPTWSSLPRNCSDPVFDLAGIGRPRIVLDKWVKQRIGFWMQDSSPLPGREDDVYVSSELYTIFHFANESSLKSLRLRHRLALPFNGGLWVGSSVVRKGHLFYSQFENWRIIVKFDLEGRRIVMKRLLPSVLVEEDDYADRRRTFVEFAADEDGLYLIYSNFVGDVHVSLINETSLQFVKTWVTDISKYYLARLVIVAGQLYPVRTTLNRTVFKITDRYCIRERRTNANDKTSIPIKKISLRSPIQLVTITGNMYSVKYSASDQSLFLWDSISLLKYKVSLSAAVKNHYSHEMELPPTFPSTEDASNQSESEDEFTEETRSTWGPVATTLTHGRLTSGCYKTTRFQRRLLHCALLMCLLQISFFLYTAILSTP